MPSSPRHTRENRFLWRSFYHHSRTFSLATRLLPRDVQMPVASLYLFCRSVDTLADERVQQVGADVALRELDDLREALEATLGGRPPEALVWQRLANVHQRYGLNHAPLFELLDGARWDLEARPIEDRDDLVSYSNLVGGSVGAMMLPFLFDGSWEAKLEHPARSLGIAMQIANIVRDVGEDLRELDRMYLPTTWLRRHDLTLDDLRDGPLPHGYPALVEEAMRTAEHFFDQGEAGIEALPLRVRPAIRSAARMYREIMNEVRARAYDNIRHRAYVSLPRKLSLIVYDSYQSRRNRLSTAKTCRPPVLAPVVQPQP